MSTCTYEKEFVEILKEELVPAEGCTEPISVAFAGAKAREVLNGIPDTINIRCSGDLIKNIRCVTVPNTGNLVGIEASVIAGIVGGDSSKKLEVISNLSEDLLPEIHELLNKNIVKVSLLETPLNLHYILECKKGKDSCKIEIKDFHTNITKIVKNGEIIFEKNNEGNFYKSGIDRSMLTVEKIKTFADTVDISVLKSLLSKQVEYNMKIAKNCLEKNFAVSIGKTILKHDSTIYGRMKAFAASASEARMSGCSMPVIINSGSGNQGIASSVPIVIYSQENKLTEEKMFRALALSNLLTIYQKSHIGRLSAFCGAISATVSSGAALTYLENGSLEQIKMTIINSLANVSGVVCDGAKPSCASKIVTGLEASFLGHFLALDNHSYNPFSGIIKQDADSTITAVGKIARQGMKETDHVILKIMMED